MAGNLLQQFYNIADTLIVGRVLGKNALAAVGSSYTLMTFLTSIFLGLSMGSGTLFSIYRGKGDEASLKASNTHALDLILAFLRVPTEVWDGMRVLLPYTLSARFGETGIWVAILIGWVLADITGLLYIKRVRL